MDKQEVCVYEPTEESFHDLSELGVEDILDLSSESFVEFVTVLSSNLLIYCYSSILTSDASKDRRVHEVPRER